jgi:hypothetical protein
LHGGVAGCAEQLEGQQHLVALDQLAHLFHRLRRRVAVVILNQVDLAAVHAALVVDHLDVGGLRLGDRCVCGGWPGERSGLADLDFSVACAGIVLLLREGRGGRDAERDHRSDRKR